MEAYLRFYCLVQGYALGVAALVMGPLIAWADYPELTGDVEYLYSAHPYFHIFWIGTVGMWLVVVMWMLTGASFLYGIYKNERRLLYPMLFMTGIHIILIMLGGVMDCVEMIEFNYELNISMLDPSRLAYVVYWLIHTGMTVAVLGNLFDENVQTWSGIAFDGQESTILGQRSVPAQANIEVLW